MTLGKAHLELLAVYWVMERLQHKGLVEVGGPRLACGEAQIAGKTAASMMTESRFAECLKIVYPTCTEYMMAARLAKHCRLIEAANPASP